VAVEILIYLGTFVGMQTDTYIRVHDKHFRSRKVHCAILSTMLSTVLARRVRTYIKTDVESR